MASRRLLPRARKPSDSGKWFRIVNAGDTAQVHIYNEIGGWGITADKFKADLDGIKAGTIEVRVNSIGGDVFDGIAIHNALKQHPARVNVVVDGVAASIASVIAMAGDTVTMSRGSQMMIHEAYTAAVGNAGDMRRQADLLDKYSNTIASFYADKAGGEQADWRTRMQAETWFDADEAVKAGLADEVMSPTRAVKAQWDLSVFNYAGRSKAPPPDLMPRKESPPVELDPDEALEPDQGLIPDEDQEVETDPAPDVGVAPRKRVPPKPNASLAAGSTKTAARDNKWASLTGPLLNPSSTGDAGLFAALLEASR